MSRIELVNSEAMTDLFLEASGDETEDVGVFPASFAQGRLWFLNRLEGASAVYNMPTALHLNGRFDERALQAALAKIVARHEVLRTSFTEVDGQVMQVVEPALGVHLRVHDLGRDGRPSRHAYSTRRRSGRSTCASLR
jgi:hypothetical protein